MQHARNVALSKHVINYCLQSGFLYYNLTNLQRKGIPYLPPGDALGSHGTVINIQNYLTITPVSSIG